MDHSDATVQLSLSPLSRTGGSPSFQEAVLPVTSGLEESQIVQGSEREDIDCSSLGQWSLHPQPI